MLKNKLKSTRNKLLAIVAPIILALVLIGLFLPAQNVDIEGTGNLCIETRVALAANTPSSTMVAGESIPQQIDPELVEQTWMRTRNSKVFHSYIIHQDYHDIYLDAVHYEVGHDRIIETETGTETVYWTTWEDIDNTLEPAGLLSPWDWQMTKADYHVYILENFTYGQILKFEKADPYGTVLGNVAFQPMALQWTNDIDGIQEISMPRTGILSVANNKIEWKDAYGPNIDFSWTCYSTRLVKVLTVDSLGDLSAPEQYIIDGINPVLELDFIFAPSKELDVYIDGILWNKVTKKQTFGIVEFKLGEETLWGFMPLSVWDSLGNEITVVQELKKSGGKLHVSVRVPYDWIQAATFPIYIDAVIDEYVETSSDDAHEVVSDGSMDLTDTVIDLGSYTDGPTHAGLRFTGIDTTDVENVSTAYLEFYPAEDDSGAVSYTWYGEDVASATTFTIGAFDISNRARTTASVTENPPVDWVTDTLVQTADLSDILNEIFSREDWVSDNDLSILNIYNSGNGERRLRSWDYNDHSKAPKLHFENPTEVTYYFNAYDTVTEKWTTTPQYAVDNILTNYASTTVDNQVELLTGNTCNGTDFGTITKVELRAYAYGDADDKLYIRPEFTGGTGDNHITVPGLTPAWGDYQDITSDPNAPDWSSWSHIQDLDVDIELDDTAKGNTMYCAKVEIRVTYELYPEAPTNLASPSQTETTIDLTWTLGTNTDKTLIRFKEGNYPTSITDGYQAYFDTGASVTVTGEYSIIQSSSNAAIAVDAAGPRVAERVNSFPVTNISRVSFLLYKIGLPTGTAYIRIRKVSDDSILATIAEKDVSTLTTTATWYDFDCNVNNPTEQDLRFTVECDVGDSSNYIVTKFQSTDVLANAVYTGYITSWTDISYKDLAIKIYYSNPLQPATTYYFRAWGYQSASALYSSTTADLTQATSGAGEANISSTPSTYNFGNVVESSTSSTGLTYFTVNNTSGAAVNITIHSANFTGGNGWIVSDIASPGSDIAGIKAGLSGQSYNVTVKNSPTYDTLINGMADQSNQQWGIQLLAPTSFSDGVVKSANVTLTATLS